jgi:O-antigen/teichoic acid export membrane protein
MRATPLACRLLVEGDMTNKRLVARNVLSNWAGLATHMLAGFIVAPFLILNLGRESYGLWVLIASLTGYFSLLDLGISASIGRNAAFHHAKQDREGVNAIVSTALALLTVVSLIALVGTIVVHWLFFRLFDVPPEQYADVSLAVWLVGLNLALTFQNNVWGGTLWALQRFDVMNVIVIPTVIIRTALTFWLVPMGCGLSGLGLIVLITTVLEWIAKMIATFLLDPELRLRFSLVKRDVGKRLWGYGIWYFFLSMERSLGDRFLMPIVGSVLGAGMATLFSIPARLIGYASSVLVSGTQVLTPLATALHAEDKQRQQRHLVLEGGKYCLALALVFLTLFALLGRSLIALWIGPGWDQAWDLLMIMALGEVLPMSQWLSYSTILGMNRHRLMAWLSIVEGLTVVALALALVRFLGLTGVCLAMAIPGAISRGLCQMTYACHIVKLPLRTYLLFGLLPAVSTALLPAIVLALLVSWHAPTSWVQLIGYTVGYGLCFVGIGLLVSRLALTWRRAVRRPAVEGPSVLVSEGVAQAPAGS